jgi:DNA replication protein DnaC
MPKTLPPLPEGMIGRTLTDEQYKWLCRKYGNALSKGPEDCPTCRGTKTFVHASDGEVYECSCRDQWLLHLTFAYAGIDRRYQQYTWQDTENVSDDALRLAKDYVAFLDGFIDRGIGLILYGEQRGTGKTLLTSLILKSAIAQNHSAVFVTHNDLLDMYGDTFYDKKQRAEFDQRIRYVDLLAIDDIGREHKNRSEMADSALDSLLRSRVAGMRPTIITTNIEVGEVKNDDEGTPLARRYSENIVSLLREASVVQQVSGTDYRDRSMKAVMREVVSGQTRPVTVG